jgi:uridine kinase
MYGILLYSKFVYCNVLYSLADPRLTDYELLLQNLTDLRAGRTTQVPIYDFKTSSRIGFNEVAVPSSRVIILEGIYALSERLRPMLDLRVSVTGGVHFDLIKRVLRDISRSGQGPDEIIQQVRGGPGQGAGFRVRCVGGGYRV